MDYPLGRQARKVQKFGVRGERKKERKGENRNGDKAMKKN